MEDIDIVVEAVNGDKDAFFNSNNGACPKHHPNKGGGSEKLVELILRWFLVL
jgi:hypothetical protein